MFPCWDEESLPSDGEGTFPLGVQPLLISSLQEAPRFAPNTVAFAVPNIGIPLWPSPGRDPASDELIMPERCRCRFQCFNEAHPFMLERRVWLCSTCADVSLETGEIAPSCQCREPSCCVAIVPELTSAVDEADGILYFVFGGRIVWFVGFLVLRS